MKSCKMVTCDYCGKNFSTISSLNNHKKTALYCIKAREGTKNTENICKYCDKSFTTKYSLKTHLSTCSIKKDIELELYKKNIEKEHREELSRIKIKYKVIVSSHKETNKKLEKHIKSLNDKIITLEGRLKEQDGYIDGLKTAPEKKTIYNTAIHPKLMNLPINNIPALTDEYVIERINDGILTYEKATRGYRGMLEVICDLITHENERGEIERNYVCTDVSRNSFHRLLESKKWKSDKGGRYLNNMLNTFRDVMKKYKDEAYEIYNQTPHDSFEWDQVDWERKNISLLYSGIISKEGTKSREELVNILRKEISKRASV